MTNLVYNDTGLLVLTAAVPPDVQTHRYILDVLCEQLLLMTDPKQLSDQELERAKNRLKSNLLMSLESQIVQAEDIGRQVLIHGDR